MTMEVSNEIEPSQGLSVTDDVETTSTPASESTDGPAQESATVGATVTAQVSDNATVANAYAPNFKYKVGNTEKEISEKYRSLIKDAESEKEVRDLFEKADGIDLVKQSRSALKAEFDGFRDQIKPVLTEYHMFTSLRDNGVKGDFASLNSALDMAGIDDETLMKYMMHKLEIEKNPAYMQVHNQQVQNTVQLLKYENQNKVHEYSQEQERFNAHVNEFENQIMSNTAVINQIESLMGKQGAIRDEAVAYGAYMQQIQNKMVSPQEAIQHAISKYQPFINMQPAPVAQAVPAHKPPATIPATDGGPASVVKVLPKSIADLKKAAREAV